jgi:hypothetical protein
MPNSIRRLHTVVTAMIAMLLSHGALSAPATLEVSFEVDATQAGAAPNALRTATESIAIIHWNELLFYPAGVQSDDMQIAAKLRLPAGWSLGTALPQSAAGNAAGDIAQFGNVSLTILSPRTP